MSARENTPRQSGWTTKALVIGIIAVAAVLVFGSWWMNQSARNATESAVRSVSMFYLDELTGRREQVVESNINSNIDTLQIAVEQLTPEDLSDTEHLQAFQSEMKQLFGLEKFAFVGESGLIYTSTGTQDNIDEYSFDREAMTGPEVSVKDLQTDNPLIIIAIPLENVSVSGDPLTICFMEMTSQSMTDGLSLQSDANETTFCNIYTNDGVALTNMVLGGLAKEDNLLEALKHAKFDQGYSLETIVDDFHNGRGGVASFTYNGTRETLDYMPVKGTDWMLTYLIRENVITEQVSHISDGIAMRGILQTVLTAVVLAAVAVIILMQIRRNTRMLYEREAAEAANHVKQEEMEQRLELQEKLLEQEKHRAEQDKMITALASDYRGVYYADLDTGEGVCYQADTRNKSKIAEGDRFRFHDALVEYAHEHVHEAFREDFLKFIEPESIRTALEAEPVISFRYLTDRDGREAYEMLRMAGVRHVEDRDDGIVHAVGVGFTDVDAETREQMAQSQALSDALTVAEEASKAKTAFLSSMSHEIRTPMNAIIGLDSIALADPDLTDKTRDHLEKIGDSARHLLGLINDILDVSRIESGRMVIKNEQFSFSKMLEQVNTIIGGQCDDKGLEYRCSITGGVDGAYIGDEMKLKQTLINILGNAVKFTPEGGKVELGIERIAHFGGKSTLRFTMSDTGIGMSEEFLPRLFDTFSQEDSSSTNKYGSTGLGMAITKNIVEMMNGTIEVTSKKGEGTTFTVTVTLLDASDLGDDNDELRIDPEKLNVLVIDDDPVACEHAKVVLEEVGIGVSTALSGAEAIETIRLRHARRTPFNLILVDLKMPEMDGIETTRRIREIVGNESAVIILTAYNWDDVLVEALDAGVDNFIAKPLFASSVLDQFRDSLKKKQVARGEERRAELAGRRILVAEDMSINVEILRMLMETRQVEIEHAENGRIAVDMFESHPAGYYDAILMDMRMPEMDGLTATATIRALDRDDAKRIPIIALTANAFDEDVQQSLQVGMNAHLSKPVEPENLFDTLELLIED
ncbi:MAG: response regulator [Coriobacteriales bacterium]|jgi:signal transduction histidine kinase/CheY-like chemotaxis protein